LLTSPCFLFIGILQKKFFGLRKFASADPGGHVISMLAFGYLGYWAHRWDERASVLIAEKRAEITERRKKRIARAEEASAAALAEAS
jgi:hypothetical protein